VWLFFSSEHDWGRPDSIARTLAIPTNFIAATAYPYDWKISNGYKTAISDSYHQDDYLWRNHKNGATDPCPDGWHVPSQSAFAAIFNGTADVDVYGNATANTWTPTGTWSWTSASDYGNGGMAVRPDGSTITLFFPNAGLRDSASGNLDRVGLNGTYWTSTTGAVGAYTINFSITSVWPGYIMRRAMGYSVRCVSQ
jgi:uncharacterized protein (TIGR02145 family)